MAAPIHWHEGLFLQPHHLQRLQKTVVDGFADERRLTWSYPYGVVEARLSHDELENMRVRFDKLRVIMPAVAKSLFLTTGTSLSRYQTGVREQRRDSLILLGVPLSV